MRRILRFCLLIEVGVVAIGAGAWPVTAQHTSMESARANRSKVTIEGLVRDVACQFIVVLL